MKYLFFMLLFIQVLPVTAADLVPFTEKQRQAMQIETAAIQVASSSTSASLPAKVVVPNAQLHVITAPLRGLVKTLLAAEGEAVTQGQVLAMIQSPELLKLQGEYLEAHTRYQLAKGNYDRDRELNKDGLVAERRFLESKAEYQGALTTQARLKRMLELSDMDEASLALLRKDRNLDSSLVVTAPFNGVILDQMTTVGKRVEAADPLYQVASLKPLWLEIHVPLQQASELQPGHQVIVPDLHLAGPITTIGKMVHGADQGVLVRAEIHEGSEKLRPGQFVLAQLSIESGENNYRVPRSAVTRSEGSSYIFSEQAGGFQPVQVRVIAEETDALVIATDIPEQSQIVVSGTASVKAAWLGGE